MLTSSSSSSSPIVDKVSIQDEAMSTSGSDSKCSPQAPVVASPNTTFAAAATKAPPAVELNVAIRRVRVVILATAMISLLLAIVFTLREGRELWQFNGSSKTAAQQEKMLDDYNSYSANVATVFGTPVELFVGAAVQVILLRFLTRSITASEPTWKINAVSVAAGAVTVYLISNGFNAVNVQFRQRGIDAVISPEDLSLNYNASVVGLSTNATHSYPETQPRNPITNTILRNAVLPRVLNQLPHCQTTPLSTPPLPATAVEYGFAQRDWQTRVLQEALPTQQLRVTATRKNMAIQDGATVSDMPMNASIAADLYLYGMNVMISTFDMDINYLNESEIRKRNPSLNSSSPYYPEDLTNTSLATVVGLLPSDKTSDEAARRAFFLKSSASGLYSQLGATANMSANMSANAQINMTLSHVQITDTIAFDAVTFDFEIDPMMMARASSRGNATRYFDFRNSDQCGAVPGQCLLKKALFGHDSLEYDPPAQIQAFAQCLNGQGTEEMQSFGFQDAHPYLISCKGASTNSILLFSIGKRVIADALSPNQSLNGFVFNMTAPGFRENSGTNVITNASKVFTVTMGRLSWKWSNLALDFGASCASGDAESGCLGLQLPLANTSTGTTQQTLVAGAKTLSVSTLSPFSKAVLFKPRMLPLALIREPTMRNAKDLFVKNFYGGNDDAEAGDVLLSHNIKVRNWTETSSLTNTYDCFSEREERINSTLNNHLYNENGLQATYTSAVFFLFENAVVRDVVRLNSNATTLDFKQNVKHVAVWLSIPDRSAWLTLAGCVLLVIGLIAALIQSVTLSKAQNDSLSKITAPHVIARVMLDEGQFPPLLLHRQIVSSLGGGEHRKVDQFAIDALGLQHQESQDRLVAAV